MRSKIISFEVLRRFCHDVIFNLICSQFILKHTLLIDACMRCISTIEFVFISIGSKY